jgi:hypothetical protein
MIKVRHEPNTFYTTVILIDPCELFAISFLAIMADGQMVVLKFPGCRSGPLLIKSLVKCDAVVN